MMRGWLVVVALWIVAAGPVDPDLAAGVAAYNRGDIATAFRRLDLAAGRGEPQAQVNLGYLYVRGQGTAPNRAEALRLYRLAAKTGDGEAMNAIGVNYEYGNEIVPRDIDEAVRWYCAAVRAGNPRAMNNLALLHAEGHGVPQDVAEARSLWRQSADRGHVNSMFNLGRSLLQAGDASGEAWLFRAAERGHGLAQDLLRRAGRGGRWPAPVDSAALMEVQPEDGPPGVSRYCQALTS